MITLLHIQFDERG